MPSYDSPWKEALYQHLRLLLLLLFPRLAARVDWREDYESLEQELRRLAPEAEAGTRLADALIKVRLLTGDERILHAEVQAQPQQEFPSRAYGYHYRGHDRFGLPPESLVILADDDPRWRPARYEVALDYTRLTFEFEPVKLLDWAGREEALRDHENPMGLFVLAHLEAMRTRKDVEERARVKLDLLLRLAARRLDEEETRLWYRYLDWFLDLPADIDRQVYTQALAQSKEKGMPFVTLADRIAREEGLKEGLKEGKVEGLKEGLKEGQLKGLLIALRPLLRVKFGAEGEALMPAAERIADPEKLAELVAAVENATSIEEIRARLSP